MAQKNNNNKRWGRKRYERGHWGVGDADADGDRDEARKT